MAMKKFAGYEEKASEPSRQLPVGSYVLKIINVKYVEGEDGKSDRIEMAVDIAEGEHKGFFKAQYDANTNEDKKFKGKAIIWMPDDSGSDNDKRAKRTFNSFAAYLAEANTGYHWDWNEQSLKNKLIGGTYRQEFNVLDGKEVSYTTFAWFCSVNAVREGKATEAKPKYRNGATGNVSGTGSTKTDNNGFMDIPEGTEEDFPF